MRYRGSEICPDERTNVPAGQSVNIMSSPTLSSCEKVKVKVEVGFLYSAAYAMTGPARFTISEVAVDW